MCLHQSQILSKYGRSTRRGHDSIQQRTLLTKTVLVPGECLGDWIILEHFDNQGANRQLILENENVALNRDVLNGIRQIGCPIRVDSPASRGFPRLSKSGCEPFRFVRSSRYVDRDV